MNLDAFMAQLKKVHDLSESAAGRMQLAHNMLRAAPMLGKKAGEVREFANTVWPVRVRVSHPRNSH
jgi:hypothetical protein